MKTLRGQQQIEVLGHRARQRIFDGNDRRLHRAAFHAVEDLS